MIVPDTFYMVLDVGHVTLAWVVGYQCLGQLYTGLYGWVYSMVSLVWGYYEIALRYLGTSDTYTVFSLKGVIKVEGMVSMGNSTGSSNLGV